MKHKLNALIRSHFLFSATRNFNLFFPNAYPFETVISNPRFYVTATFPAIESFSEKTETNGNREKPTEAADVLTRWGFTEKDVSIIFLRHPSLYKMDAHRLQSKLQTLSNLGLSSSDLAKMLQCRPRVLNSRLAEDLDERIQSLHSLFGSREVLLKAISRNPSLLNYELRDKIKLVATSFENVGVCRDDLKSMLLSRPTLISHYTLNDEKMDYIRRTGVSKDSRMYKHVVAIFSVSRVGTVREKIANLEKFGLSEDEVLSLFGRHPILLTFSIDKIQRNMTFILGTMKLSARTVLAHTFLLCFNLDKLLKPRIFLARKIDNMDLAPRINGPSLMTALRMSEKRFVYAFINCHPETVAKELMVFYTSAKCTKRLAESSKKFMHNGFPFRIY